ncbi:MAG TPA: DUF1572 family protein [Vicinamibacterales bacterium]|nr:DUF1572 family protein [Vicinamibacterales bacterium]
MTGIVQSIRGECMRYKSLAEAAFAQVAETDLSVDGPNGGNSMAVIAWHVSGNLRSRFTDFLTSDGEKPWRHRDEEFEKRAVSRVELDEKWNGGWAALLATLDSLTDADLARTVTVRQQPMLVSEALHRALAHLAYHTGQIVYLGKVFKGDQWKSLSIPLGQSETYNRNPISERPDAHAAHLKR